MGRTRTGTTTVNPDMPQRQPVSRKFLVKQLRRVDTLLPRDNFAREEYVKAIGAGAWDEKHVKAIIDSLVSDTLDLTKVMPADLRRIAWQTRPDDAGSSWGCEKCGGTGWCQVTIGGATGVEPCSCRKET